MKIIWMAFKRFDRDVDRITWVEMTKELLKKGHSIRLVVPSSGKKLDFGLGKNIRYLPAIPWRIFFSFSFAFVLFLYSIPALLCWRPDFVILDHLAFFPVLPFIILLRLRLIKTKFVLNIRSIPVEVNDMTLCTKEKIYKLALFFARFFLNGIAVISPSMKQHVCDSYHINNDMVGIWGSGVSCEIFNAENINMINEPPFCYKKFIVMYHGTLTKNRGLQETIKAMKILHREYHDIVFFILGDGSAKKELESLIKEFHLQDIIFLHEPVPYRDVPKYIASCDVGIVALPRIIWWNVSCPLKLLEYLIMGKPVIVTDIEAHREIIGHSPCGIFIKSHDPEDIAGGIKKAYHFGTTLRTMGKLGKELVSRKYTWEKQAKNLIHFLKTL